MTRFVCVTALLLLAASAQAEDFSYNAFSLSYSRTDIDDLNIDGDGIGLGVSVEVGDDFFVFGGFGSGDLDSNLGVSADFDQWDVGLGYHTALAESVDLVAQLSYQSVELSVPGFGSVDDDGIGVGVGLRVAASEVIELNAGISYVDLDNSGDDTSFGAGILYNFTEAFSLGLFGNFGDDVSSYSLGGRFYFGR